MTWQGPPRHPSQRGSRCRVDSNSNVCAVAVGSPSRRSVVPAPQRRAAFWTDMERAQFVHPHKLPLSCPSLMALPGLSLWKGSAATHLLHSAQCKRTLFSSSTLCTLHSSFGVLKHPYMRSCGVSKTNGFPHELHQITESFP